jgi:hypothetical protein
MTKYNFNYAKPDENGYPVFPQVPLAYDVQHHEEWDEPVIDPETGEPTGETEHRSYDWTEHRKVLQPFAADFAAAGFLRLHDLPPSDTAPDGQHYAKTGKIEIVESRYCRWSYSLVPDPAPPPRVFSKLYLELALFKDGLLDAVDAFIDSKTIIDKDTGKEMPLRRAYSTALTFAEDNEYFAPFLTEVKETLGIDDATVEAILSASVERGR